MNATEQRIHDALATLVKAVGMPFVLASLAIIAEEQSTPVAAEEPKVAEELAVLPYSESWIADYEKADMLAKHNNDFQLAVPHTPPFNP